MARLTHSEKLTNKARRDWVNDEAIDTDGLIEVMSGFTGLKKAEVVRIVAGISKVLYNVNRMGKGWRIMGVGALTHRIDSKGRMMGLVVRETGSEIKARLISRCKLVNHIADGLKTDKDTALAYWRAYCESIKMIIEIPRPVNIFGLGCLNPGVEELEWRQSPLCMVGLIQHVC